MLFHSGLDDLPSLTLWGLWRRSALPNLPDGPLAGMAARNAPGSGQCVGLKLFVIGQCFGNRCQFSSAFRRAVDYGTALLEVVDTQRREEPCRPGSRQDVTRPGAIVAQRFGSVPAKKHRASVSNFVQPLLRLINGQLKVLGCNGVADIQRILFVGGKYQSAALGQ